MLRGQVRHDEPMSRHCSWKAGGAAKTFFVPKDMEDLQVFLGQCPPHEPICLVGLGSNLLVRDGGFAGTIILTHGALSSIHWSQEARTEVEAEAGVAAPKLARFAGRHRLEGAEFLVGIPGTVGGALAMNAGCYGSETWDHVISVRTVDRGGVIRTRLPEEFEVGYRHVGLKPQSGHGLGSDEWFLSGRFRFREGDPMKAQSTMTALLKRRIESQPLATPNAGSVFRNPEGQFAAQLIDGCGLKGVQVGGAEVSTRHANFIVNTGRASAADIEALLDQVQDTVQKKLGITLEREVRIIGERTC